MLKAMVLVCNLMVTNDCVEFTDNRGLHETQEQCRVRVDEMINDIIPTLPAVPYKFFFKCETVDSI